MTRNKHSILYKIHFNVANTFISANYTNMEVWHRRLEHLNKRYFGKLKTMSSNFECETGDKLSSSVCETYTEVKQPRLPFNGNRTRATRPLEMVQIDICGPINSTTWDGKRYFITFLDDYTHSCLVYLISSKSETLKYFNIFEAMVKAMFGNKIVKLRCDNVSEYVSNEYKSF